MRTEVFLNEAILLLIGGFITLIAAVLLYILQQIILRFIKRSGKVSIYYKHIYDLINGNPASFKKDNQSLTIPLWLEIHNNKEVNQVVRNVNLALYDSGKMIDKATQANIIKQGDQKKYLGNNGSYSFNLPPESIHQFEVYYIFEKSETNEEFDSIFLTYYTSKDKMISSKILDIPDGWQTKSLNLNKDWTESN